MQSVKTVAMLAMLGLVGWGVYVALHRKPQPDAPHAGANNPKPDATTPAARTGAPAADKDPQRFAAPPQRLTTQADTTPPGVTSPFGNPSLNPAAGGSAVPAANNPLARVAPGGPMTTLPPTSPLAGSNTGAPAAGAGGSALFADIWRTVQQKLKAGQISDAHLALSMLYDHEMLTPAEAKQVRELLDQLAGTVVFSTQHLLEPAYVVKPGERLNDIAAKYQVPPELLAKINGVDPSSMLRPGETLKVVSGPFQAAVNLDRHELTLMVQGRYAGRFKIGVGRDLKLPEGSYTYTVQEKVKNPKYAVAGQPEISGGSERNPLGKRWIGLGGYVGIHGTNDPTRTIDHDDVPGSITLSPTDADDVFDILTIGSKVVVRR